jgi:hypothetical protein
MFNAGGDAIPLRYALSDQIVQLLYCGPDGAGEAVLDERGELARDQVAFDAVVAEDPSVPRSERAIVGKQHPGVRDR